MAITGTRLNMGFITSDGKKKTLTVPDPKSDLTEEIIKPVMEDIITKNIFDYGGATLSSIDTVQIVTTEVEDIIKK